MKHFVIEASSVSNGVIAKASSLMEKHITEKDSSDEAMMLFHQTRASQLANNNLTYSLCEVIDESGNVLIKEYTKK